MNQIMLLLALAALLLAIGVQLFRTMRADGYGKRPPPPSRYEEVRAARPYRSVV